MAVELLHEPAGLRLYVGNRRGFVRLGRQHDVEVVEMAQDEGAIGDAAYRGEHDLLGGQLEVYGTLGKNAVLELEGP